MTGYAALVALCLAIGAFGLATVAIHLAARALTHQHTRHRREIGLPGDDSDWLRLLHGDA